MNEPNFNSLDPNTRNDLVEAVTDLLDSEQDNEDLQEAIDGYLSTGGTVGELIEDLIIEAMENMLGVEL